MLVHRTKKLFVGSDISYFHEILLELCPSESAFTGEKKEKKYGSHKSCLIWVCSVSKSVKRCLFEVNGKLMNCLLVAC